jgi:hypothetical protein
MQHLPRLDTVTSSFAESFDAPVLDPERWVDHYLPQWTTAERSQARYDLPGPGQPPGLRLRIDADQLDWRPEDAPLRVSNLQTAVFSGPLRSTRGTHRHRQDGLTVRTKVSPRLLWAPRFGQVDVTVTASRDRGCMLAAWLVGTEHLDEDDSGEVCLFEIDSDAVKTDSTTARVGIKAHHDPRLSVEMEEVIVPVGAGQAHTWSARWSPDGVVIACEQAVVFASAQVLSYPLQLMVDLFETGPRNRADTYPKTAVIHAVTGS